MLQIGVMRVHIRSCRSQGWQNGILEANVCGIGAGGLVVELQTLQPEALGVDDGWTERDAGEPGFDRRGAPRAGRGAAGK
jgi:hypothetical protein